VILDVQDGTLSITTTPECAYYIQYDNRLAPSEDIEIVEYEGLKIMIFRAFESLPETMVVFDNVMKKNYEIPVEDNTIGELCIPHFLGM